MSDGFRRAAGAAIWFAIIVAIALGAAGIVDGMNQPLTTTTSPSGGTGGTGGTDGTLQFPGDAEVISQLDAAAADLATLTAKVEALGTQARAALAALNSTDTTASETAITAGDDLVADVARRATLLRAELAGVRYVGSPDAGLKVSEGVIARYAALVAALDATDGLDADWARLSEGAVAATKMSGYLAEHDRLIGEAAERGRVAKYDEAIATIDQASLQLDAATAQRDELMRTVDVTVLDEWIGRNRDYDVALKDLYNEIKKVGHKVTAATKKAVKAEAAARARLPPDTRGLVIIMADIGRAGMNGAVIDIEEARTTLNDALDAASATVSPAPGASTGP